VTNYSPVQLLYGIAYALLCAVLIPCLMVSCLVIETIDIIRDFAKVSRSLFVKRVAILLVAAGCSLFSCNVVIGCGLHSRLVAKSGIRPHSIGAFEGVGASTRGYAAARSNACYWGKRQALSVQYSKRGHFRTSMTSDSKPTKLACMVCRMEAIGADHANG